MSESHLSKMFHKYWQLSNWISFIDDDDLIKAIIDSDRHSTTREIVEKLHVSHTCIEKHLKQLGT